MLVLKWKLKAVIVASPLVQLNVVISLGEIKAPLPLFSDSLMFNIGWDSLSPLSCEPLHKGSPAILYFILLMGSISKYFTDESFTGLSQNISCIILIWRNKGIYPPKSSQAAQTCCGLKSQWAPSVWLWQTACETTPSLLGQSCSSCTKRRPELHNQLVKYLTLEQIKPN